MRTAVLRIRCNHGHTGGHGADGAANFLLQTIDLGMRTVKAQRVVSLPNGIPLAFQALLPQGKVVVAVRKPVNGLPPFDVAPPYEVLALVLP